MQKNSKRSSLLPVRPAEAARILKKGGVGILLTDTIYGVVASAFRPKAVERIFRLKGRNSRRPLIVLISSPVDIARFGAKFLPGQKSLALKLWREKPTSIIFSAPRKDLSYIHRGTGSIAFRLPQDAKLKRILKVSGPIVAPSANPEGQPPAVSIQEAISYFGGKPDFYLDGGRRKTKPSRLVRMGDKIEILRK